MTTDIRVHRDAGILTHTESLHSVYVDAFCAPPWHEDEAQATEFVSRLPANVRRAGFTAATAVRDGEIVGFATAWTTPSPSPPTAAIPRRPPASATTAPPTGCAEPGRSTNSPSGPPPAAPVSPPASSKR